LFLPLAKAPPARHIPGSGADQVRLMTPGEDEIAEYLNRAAALLGLPIRPEHYEEVLAAFRVLRAQAQLVAEFELPPHAEAAPRFTP
jgi:hypothetical protein